MSHLKVVAMPPKVTEHRTTPIELLEEFVADVKSGKIIPEDVMIFYVERDKDGTVRPHYWLQNVSPQLQIAYAVLLQQMALDEWKN